MLQCGVCNYCKSVNDSKVNANFVCEMTGFEFKKNIEEYEMEYPCSSSEYTIARVTSLIRNKNTDAYVVINNNWKLEYRKKNLKPTFDRYTCA